MSSYLLDTDSLISHLRGNQDAVQSISRLNDQGDLLGVCAINLAELYAGLSEAQRERAERFVDALYYFQMTTQAAKRAGRYRYDFARQGMSLSVADTLVAAVAAENDAIVVTGNSKDYPMTDVKTLDLLGRQG